MKILITNLLIWLHCLKAFFGVVYGNIWWFISYYSFSYAVQACVCICIIPRINNQQWLNVVVANWSLSSLFLLINNVFFITHKRFCTAKNVCMHHPFKCKPVTVPYFSTSAQTLSVNITKSERDFPWNWILIHCCANSSNEENMSLSPPKIDSGDIHKYGISCQRSQGKHVESGFGWINPLKLSVVPFESIAWGLTLLQGALSNEKCC